VIVCVITVWGDGVALDSPGVFDEIVVAVCVPLAAR
jgi:hypothetical protein